MCANKLSLVHLLTRVTIYINMGITFYMFVGCMWIWNDGMERWSGLLEWSSCLNAMPTSKQSAWSAMVAIKHFFNAILGQLTPVHAVLHSSSPLHHSIPSFHSSKFTYSFVGHGCIQVCGILCIPLQVFGLVQGCDDTLYTFVFEYSRVHTFRDLIRQ